MRAVAVVAAAVAAVAAGALAVVIGSSPSGAEPPTPVTSFEELTGTWEATAGPEAPTALVAPVRLTFAEGGVFVEAAGCNTGRGAVSVQDGTLVAGPFAITQKACEPPLATQEAWVFEMLEAMPAAGLSGGDELVLSWDEDHQLVLDRVAGTNAG